VTLLVAVVAGAFIGLSLGALGGGGSILAVPVLVYLLDQTAGQATTGALLVVGVTSLAGAVTAHRAGNVLVGRGLIFGSWRSEAPPPERRPRPTCRTRRCSPHSRG
jgi:uncharacterized protein